MFLLEWCGQSTARDSCMGPHHILQCMSHLWRTEGLCPRHQSHKSQLWWLHPRPQRCTWLQSLRWICLNKKSQSSRCRCPHCPHQMESLYSHRRLQGFLPVGWVVDSQNPQPRLWVQTQLAHLHYEHKLGSYSSARQWWRKCMVKIQRRTASSRPAGLRNYLHRWHQPRLCRHWEFQDPVPWRWRPRSCTGTHFHWNNHIQIVGWDRLSQ